MRALDLLQSQKRFLFPPKIALNMFPGNEAFGMAELSVDMHSAIMRNAVNADSVQRILLFFGRQAVSS